MEKILNELDEQLQATFKDKGLKAYGLCELITKDSRPNPITVDKSRVVAQIHDRFNGIFYHRIISAGGYLSASQFGGDDEFSFGKTIRKRFAPRMRTVVAYKTRLGESFMFEFANAFPDKITTLSEYKIVHLDQGNLIADHEAVFKQEYGDNSYEKHRTAWNIFALEYDIAFILC